MSDSDRNDRPGGDLPPPPPPTGGGAPPPPPPSGYGDQSGYPNQGSGDQGYGGGYQDQGYGYAGPPKNGLGIAALVLGILSIPTAFILIGPVLAILAIIFGAVGLSRVKKRQATNKGVALAGLLTGIAGLILFGVLAAFVLGSEEFQDFQDCIDSANTDQEVEDCSEQFGEELGG